MGRNQGGFIEAPGKESNLGNQTRLFPQGGTSQKSSASQQRLLGYARCKSFMIQRLSTSTISRSLSGYCAILDPITDSLQLFMERFNDEALKPNPIITQMDVKNVFSSIPVIQNYSRELHDSLGERLDSWDNDSTKIGDIILDLVSVFLLYFHSQAGFNPYLPILRATL